MVNNAQKDTLPDPRGPWEKAADMAPLSGFNGVCPICKVSGRWNRDKKDHFFFRCSRCLTMTFIYTLDALKLVREQR